jgi:hypothetical protein
MPKLKEPSIRAKKYIKNKIAGMSNYQAAVKAGYSPETAKNAAKNVEKHGVEVMMEDILNSAGLTDEYMAKKLHGATEATRIHGTNDNFVEVLDWMVILKALELGYKVKGKLIEKKDLNIKGGGVIYLPEKELDAQRSKILDSTSGTTDGSTKEE